jgi:hypothetical protein
MLFKNKNTQTYSRTPIYNDTFQRIKSSIDVWCGVAGVGLEWTG